MKKVLITIAAFCFTGLPFCLKAQDEKPSVKEHTDKIERSETDEKNAKKEKKETQEIIIHNNSEQKLNLKIEINGDDITVNGKPLSEFKDSQISINNRKMTIRDGDRVMSYDFGPDGMAFSKDFMGGWKGGKEISKPFLGVTTEGVPDGAKITEIIKGSAAEKAGLKKGDIITKIGDEKISGGDQLSDVISKKHVKEIVGLSYKRDGKESSTRTTLGERKVRTNDVFNFNGPQGDVRAFPMPNISIPHDNIYQDGANPWENLAPYVQGDNGFFRQKKLGLKIQDTEEGGNVKVIGVEEGSAAEKAGLKKDDIITEIGGKKIENTDDAREQLYPSEAKSAYTIKAKRGGAEMSFEVKFPKKLKTANL